MELPGQEMPGEVYSPLGCGGLKVHHVTLGDTDTLVLTLNPVKARIQLKHSFA